MGIELPAELAGIAGAVGVEWPEADEDALRAQAGAWRQAATDLDTLASDVDRGGERALREMSGPAADRAGRRCAALADPDTGSVAEGARGARRAADRLDHAAERVGAAKAEIVQLLADAARDTEAARAAAGAGQPGAGLSVETTRRAAAAEIAAVVAGLADEVGAAGATGAGAADPESPAVGAADHRGRPVGGGASPGGADLLAVATGAPGALPDSAPGGPVDRAAGGVVDGAREVGEAAGSTVGGTADAVDAAAGAARDAAAGPAVRGIGAPEDGAHEDGVPQDGGPQDGAPAGGDRQDRDGSVPAGRLIDEVLSGAGDSGVASPGGPPSPAPGPPAGDTGPVPVAQAPTPPAGVPRGAGDAPTPPQGVPAPGGRGHTELSGFAGAAAGGPPPPGPAASAAPSPYPPPPPQPAAPQPPGQGTGAVPPPAPQQAGTPGPPPGARWAPPPAAPQAPPQAPQQPAGPRPAAPSAPPAGNPYGAAPPPYPAPSPPRQAPAGPVPYASAAHPAPHPAPLPPRAVPPQPPQAPQPPGAGQPAPAPGAAAVPVGAPRPDRESMVALFLVHMFPIGHLPVASDRPARHYSPRDRTPGAAGPDGASDAGDVRGFPPLDHPESATVDTTPEACGGTRRPAPPPVDVLPPPPAALFVDHDPLGGRHERDWDAQYLTADGDPPGYVLPPPGRYPEGGCEPGEPVVLAEGTLIDRFGTAHGRVFAPDGTPFAHRSLPPGYRDAGYRRYRVLRDLPVWRALSAPWFGQPGGGVRYRTVYSAAELVTLGRLADVTFEQAHGNDTEGERG